MLTVELRAQEILVEKNVSIQRVLKILLFTLSGISCSWVAKSGGESCGEKTASKVKARQRF